MRWQGNGSIKIKKQQSFTVDVGMRGMNLELDL